ncbi:MAG: glycosyltransferase family 4 protein [Clostridium sp.]|nr:glycosyltransferase family 4 protein [Clostridium sp.]
MNVLFLSLLDFNSIEEHNIYSDLLREFVKYGHNVYAVSPVERRLNLETYIVSEENVRILKLRIGNIQKTNVIEKGLSTLMVGRQYIEGVKRYFKGIRFDLVLYPTPPITLAGVVKYIKKRDKATTYLMLKDIFPQNAVDMQMLSKTGIKGVLYRYFRKKEKTLYAISDYIGCMSQANVDYVLRHNPEIDAKRVEICPNSIEAQEIRISDSERTELRRKYQIPLKKTVFVYGGNLGKPQGIPFLIDCLKTQLDNPEAFFLIVGNGTEFEKLKTFFDEYRPENMRLIKTLPREDYDRMIVVCDVGMIFLDHRFTIPNFPSRLLSYMQAGLPVLACTDPNTDIGKVIEGGGFGWWCESNDAKNFDEMIQMITYKELEGIGNNGIIFLQNHYLAKQCYKRIIENLIKEDEG